MTSALQAPRALAARLDRIPPFLVVARLTLVVAIVNAHTEPLLMVLVAAIVAVVFLHERRLQRPWTWFGLAALFAATQVPEWWLIDDHVVATTYWMAAVGCSRLGVDRDRVLAVSGRLLLALIFTFAFAWKLLSSQYVSGDLWEYTLLRDDRFESVATIVGGADERVLEEQRVEVTTFTGSADPDDELFVERADRTEALATTFTWFGLLIEGTVALSFLLPLRGRARLVRPACLVTFCLTTYAIVPVVGFGVLLMTMGAAQAPEPATRRVYVASAAVIFVWNTFLTAVIL